jgi:hypothetical protein
VVELERTPDELEQALNVVRRHAADELRAAKIFDCLLLDLVKPHHRSVFWGDRLLTLDKSAGFRSDPLFAQAMQQVNSSTGANQYASPDKISWRLHTLIWAASCALKVPGDFVECGVFRGDMSWVLTEMADLPSAGKKLYAYDTFVGFDRRNSSAADFPEAPELFDRIDDEYRAPDIYPAVLARFSAKPYVSIIKGIVPDILKSHAPEKICFLHLDMNSPAAERGALEVLFDRLSDGAIIVFDDYGWILHRKQKSAADEFMNERGCSILELPTGQGLAVIHQPRSVPFAETMRGAVGQQTNAPRPGPAAARAANRPQDYLYCFDLLRPWAGEVPKGFVADFLGTLTDVKNLAAFMSEEEFRDTLGFPMTAAGGHFVQTRFPQIGNRKNAETWFEAVNWLLAASEARQRFVMVTLGASYGAQAVGSWRALQALNALPCKLVALDPVPGNVSLLKSNFRLNGIEPDEHWILPLAIGETVDPVLFPVGAPASGSQNSFSTNHPQERRRYLDGFIAAGMEREALGNLLLHNTTRISQVHGLGKQSAEIKFVSAITLAELLGPFDRVDFLESDIQQSEALVFPRFIDLLRKKVRRIHIGTHGQDTHAMLHQLFADTGWEIVFSYKPDSEHQSELGLFTTNDGILTVLNPDLDRQ